MTFRPGQSLPACELIAHNYGAEHPNKIHSDEGAAEYGYAGALVPGVGLYAYLARPAIESMGIAWIERGAMSARFLKPIYDRERVRVEAAIANADPLEIGMELINSCGVLSAVGTAKLPASMLELKPADYPRCALPPRDGLRPATIDGIETGERFGTLEFTLDLKGEVECFHRNVLATEAPFDSVCHPAYWIAQANEVVMQNVALGMWIHTASDMQHYAVGRDGERISIRSRIVAAFQKRGHELLTLDIGIFGEGDRSIAQVRHTAIINLREPSRTNE